MSANVFREVERALALADGFVLIPVECGPDVARALAKRLGETGWPVAVVEPVGDEAWREVVSQLLDVRSSDARAAMLIGSTRSPGGASSALRLLNQRRDAIAQALGRPLLWCGPPEFFKLAWERAPDFWSIRAMTYRIASPGAAWREEPLWPGTWVGDPPERLREMVALATAQGDERIASRSVAMLAEALVARGEIEEAAEVVGEGGGAASLLLVEAVIAATRGDRARALAIASDPAWTAGTPDLEGRRLIALGNLQLERDPAAATASYEEAARLLGRARDTSNVAIALANLGLVAMGAGALDAAEGRLAEALDIARRAGDARTEARVLAKLGRLHLLRRDSRRACATLEDGLARAADSGDRRAEAEVLRSLARGYLELGDPEKAEQDALRGAVIARAVGDASGAAEADEIAREARESSLS